MNNTLVALGNTNAHAAVTAAYAQISAVQHLPGHEQVAGAAILIRTMCEVLNLDVSEVMNKAQRMTIDADTNYTTTIRSLREYVKGEIA